MEDSTPMIFLTPRDSESDMQIAPGSFKVLYVYTINDGLHDGRLKVGDATYHTNKTIEEIIAESESDVHLFSSDEITAAAQSRIDQQTYTADVEHTLLWSVLAVKPDPDAADRYIAFRDYEIHNVLLNSGINKKFNREDKKRGEWFEVTLDKVQEAVRAHQNGDGSIRSTEFAEIVLRDEQVAAVDATVKIFKKGTHDAPKEFLWNAIMRFGKTLTSYALIKRMEPEVKRVLIITHRPVVSSGWYEDFQKSFADDSGWSFGSKKFGDSWDIVKNKEKFVYFASIQDLRGSWGTGLETAQDADEAALKDGHFAEAVLQKNSELFSTLFDVTIIDESHEGTKTELAAAVKGTIKTKYWLHLSGTPFNIIEDFDSEHVYSWSYIDEQRVCSEWEAKKALWTQFGLESGLKEYPGESNPYGNLPKIEIRTYELAGVFRNHPAVNSAETKFNFGKFFEVDRSALTAGKIYTDGFRQFTNVAAVDQLLNMMSDSDEHGTVDPETGQPVIDHKNFPFSRDNSKRDFAHTFWIVPTIEAAKALHERLNLHPKFSDFFVVNATGDNDGGDALAAVKSAIKKHERTITLSVGKLTTGTTVPEWTGVFMLSNMSSPMLYMQTIFRVKSSGSLPDGRVKEVGYVFDFAPDRSLNMVVEAARSNLQNKTADESDKKLDFYERQELEREAVSEVLKYLPIIAYDGSRFTKADTDHLMRSLQRVYISQTVDSGFSHSKLYDFDIHGITPDDLKLLEDAKKIVGASSMDPAVKKLVIAKSALSEADKKVAAEGKPPKDATPEDKKAWDEVSKKLDLDRQNARKLVQILTGVSVRLPMLVFATDPSIRVTVDNFTELVDDQSWAEFLPAGFKKYGEGVSWENLKKFYNKDVFEGACSEIQHRTRKMDDYTVLERVAGIANLFSSFKNPDRETILTPFSVVSRQYADTLGGLRFVDNAGLWYCKDSQGVSGVHSYRDYLESRETGTNPLILDPQWQDVEEDLQKFWNNDYTTILDVNSKTALYPLYGAASLWFRMRSQYEVANGPADKAAEDAMWTEIVANQIFANCRVPYSRAIAQRVLSGYKDQKVNASVIDVLEVRKVLKDAKLDKFTQNGDLAKAKRSLTEDEISDIWKWIFSPESIGTRSEDGTMTVADERARMVLNMAKDKVADRQQTPESNESEDAL